MKKASIFDPGIILLFIMVLILSATGVFLYGKVRVNKLERAFDQEEPVPLMLIITDGEKILTSQVFLYQLSTGKGALIDIPANTGALLPGYEKIGSIETLFDSADPQRYLDMVGGLSGLKIPFYLIMNLENLSRVVDLIGGVETFIPNPVDTEIDGKYILLPSGGFIMDGSKAAIYLRYGDPGESESEKVSRAQSFLKSLLDGLGNSAQRISNPEVAGVMEESLITNLSQRSLVTLTSAMEGLDVQNMVQLRLRGTSRSVDDQELLFPHSDGRLLRETIVQTINSLKSEEVLSEGDLQVALEIRNGTSVTGLAGRTSQLYQSFGYDVARIGNAEENYDKTVIIDRMGNQQAVKRVADVIKCNNILIQTGIEEFEDEIETRIDVLIILGKDFDGRYCKE
ncbi:LCP family protein [Marispirochaeta aestuarii]|uniref:LCP family protein n=1 Tax=Marispirochaeta aestuarii TaxID=1963862 RepID=UPI0029C64F4C|nr:LCP family protein [Marispirochaeta aestuarii]